MNRRLPEHLCWQTKKNGFDTPARRWFRTELGQQAEETLSEKNSPLLEYFDMARLRGHFKSFRNGKASFGLTAYDWFKIVTTCIWLKQVNRRLPIPAPVLALR